MIAASVVRDIPLLDVLNLLNIQVTKDLIYQPKNDLRSSRFYVTCPDSNYVFELLMTGQRWYDIRQSKGGGGSIDLVMHLYSCTFSQAMDHLVRVQQKKNLASKRG